MVKLNICVMGLGKYPVCKVVPHPDGQHDMGVALQDLNGIAMSDVIKADSVGCKDLVTHLDTVLFGKPTGV